VVRDWAAVSRVFGGKPDTAPARAPAGQAADDAPNGTVIVDEGRQRLAVVHIGGKVVFDD
jgi:hypothetical protein